MNYPLRKDIAASVSVNTGLV